MPRLRALFRTTRINPGSLTSMLALTAFLCVPPRAPAASRKTGDVGSYGTRVLGYRVRTRCPRPGPDSVGSWDDGVWILWSKSDAMNDKSSDEAEEPEPEYWLVRVLKFIGNLIHAAFIHSSPG
jgi:hypothetical protein